MSCFCNCNNVIRITSVSVTDEGYFLVASSLPDLCNGKRYLVTIPNDVITSSLEVVPVFIAYNNVNYPLIDRCIGNNVYSDQIRFINQSNCCTKCFRVVFGTSPEHFKVISQILPQSIATPNESK